MTTLLKNETAECASLVREFLIRNDPFLTPEGKAHAKGILTVLEMLEQEEGVTQEALRRLLYRFNIY